MEGLSLMLKG